MNKNSVAETLNLKTNNYENHDPSQSCPHTITKEIISSKQTQSIYSENSKINCIKFNKNDYAYIMDNNLTIHYGDGAKNKLGEDNKLYNFKFCYYIKQLNKLKFVSVGFDTINEFTNIIKPIKNNYFIYEYIFSNKLCKPYFDYEVMLDHKPTNNMITNTIKWLTVNIINIFYKKYEIVINKSNIILLDSSGIKDNRYKFSLHIIVDSKYVFKSNKDCLYIAHDLHKIDENFDMTVYSTDRMMRCIESAKDFNDLRILKLLDCEYKIKNIEMNQFEKYLITNVPKDHEIILVDTLAKKIGISKTRAKNNIKPNMTNCMKINKLINTIRNNFHEDAYFTKRTHIDPISKYKFYQFNYLDHSDKCFTGNQHDQMGFYCYIDGFGNVIVKCFSNSCKDQKYIVGNLNDVEDLNECIKINNKYLMKDDVMIGKVDDFHENSKILAIKSPMGTGKTWLMEDYMKLHNPKRILIVSTRQSYSNSISDRFKQLNFVNYLDDKRFYTHNRIIVQLESLDLLLRNIMVQPFDLIILDEIESILYQFSSTTIAGKSRDTFKLLHCLCKSKKTKILALDADLCIRTSIFLDSLKSPYGMIQNDYMDDCRFITLTQDYDNFIKQIMQSIDDGKKICIIGLSTRKLYEIAEILKIKQIKYVLHTRDTDDELKKKLKTVNDYWINFQVVLFSPTISVGVDFNVEYFDRVYSYIIPNCASARMYLQMLGRIRTIKDNNILTYFENMTSKCDQYIYNYDELIDYYKFLSTDSFLKKKIVYDEDGNLYNINKIGIYEKISIYNHIEDLNKCSNYFMTALNLLCLQKNYRLIFMDSKKPKENNDNIEVYKDKIIKSEEIDQIKCNHILLKINTNNSTEDEKFSVYKFKMLKFWGVQLDKTFMDTYFRKEINLVNLKYLMDLDMAGCLEYLDDCVDEKTNVIKEMIIVLGFDLKNLDKILSKDTFYENKKKLLGCSDFSKNYEKIRILFGKAKGVLNRNLNGNYLMNLINGYLNEFGLELICASKQGWIDGKNIRISTYKISIMNQYYHFI